MSQIFVHLVRPDDGSAFGTVHVLKKISILGIHDWTLDREILEQ